MIVKRDRTLSKLIDFESKAQKDLAEYVAKEQGYNLKNWIERLIKDRLKYAKNNED